MDQDVLYRWVYALLLDPGLVTTTCRYTVGKDGIAWGITVHEQCWEPLSVLMRTYI